MKKLLLILSIVLLYCRVCGQVVFENKDQRWTFDGVEQTDKYTALAFDILIKNNKPGCFDAHKEDKRTSSIYIQGRFGKSNLFESKFQGKYNPWVDRSSRVHFDYYDNKNKNKIAHAVFFFSRVPAGIDKIDLHYDGGIGDEDSDCEEYVCPIFDLKDIALPNNENTAIQSNWTEESLIMHWKNNGISDPIEGIYSFYNTNNEAWWGKVHHRIAIIQSKVAGYDIIYLSGANTGVWKEGEVKGRILKSSTESLFSVSLWLIENKIGSAENFYIRKDNEGITLYNSMTENKTKFIKIYPEGEH